ncbi:MAG TPA: site-2 protease family protein [Aggregatilinea sp.]|uniref:site-2 protease family protein n=1 Tax=Aggregatilinea sp. TaxID=2806333 RepID=UPI002B8722C9|nr:site-2 protease family protein [Aggregatilinea sp.]HML21475.1 site-2 protease family protein [Aggregatilinea sp.]
MSLSESFTNASHSEAPAPPHQPATATEAAPAPDGNLLKLRQALDGVMEILGEQREYQQRVGQIYIFRGHLLAPRDTAYATLTERIKPLGYTPMLQRERGEEVVIAIEGDLPQRRFSSPWWLHLGLLLVTIASTTVMGASIVGWPPSYFMDLIDKGDMRALWDYLQKGLPFSLTLLGILGTHEMGHYVAGRLHGVKVTLPFFIPLPVPNTLGTLGAVIFIKSPLLNRRALFDVGIAGPLAGLVVALPLYAIGVTQPQAVGLPTSWMSANITRVANPPLLDGIARLVAPEIGNLDRFVLQGHPMALAAWFGVLLTALNLLPLGQFDGGHVSYALFGRRAWTLAMVTFTVLIMLGFVGGVFMWLIWAFMGLLTGLRHPPPHDDVQPLGLPRTIIGLATIIIFFLILIPVPFYSPT